MRGDCALKIRFGQPVVARVSCQVAKPGQCLAIAFIQLQNLVESISRLILLTEFPQQGPEIHQ